MPNKTRFSTTLSLKILAVDDELLIRRSLQLAGEAKGHLVKTAENGKTALALWPSFDPDIAFIDILMPVMDGLELLNKIPKNSTAKIILISAHDKMSEKNIQNHRVDLFVRKPFADIFQLIDQAERFFKKA